MSPRKDDFNNRLPRTSCLVAISFCASALPALLR